MTSAVGAAQARAAAREQAAEEVAPELALEECRVAVTVATARLKIDAEVDF